MTNSRQKLPMEYVKAINKILKPYQIRITKGNNKRLLIRRRLPKTDLPPSWNDSAAVAVVDFHNLPRLLSEPKWERDMVEANKRGAEGWNWHLFREYRPEVMIDFIPPIITEEDLKQITRQVVMGKLNII